MPSVVPSIEPANNFKSTPKEDGTANATDSSLEVKKRSSNDGIEAALQRWWSASKDTDEKRVRLEFFNKELDAIRRLLSSGSPSLAQFEVRKHYEPKDELSENLDFATFSSALLEQVKGWTSSSNTTFQCAVLGELLARLSSLRSLSEYEGSASVEKQFTVVASLFETKVKLEDPQSATGSAYLEEGDEKRFYIDFTEYANSPTKVNEAIDLLFLENQDVSEAVPLGDPTQVVLNWMVDLLGPSTLTTDTRNRSGLLVTKASKLSNEELKGLSVVKAHNELCSLLETWAFTVKQRGYTNEALNEQIAKDVATHLRQKDILIRSDKNRVDQLWNPNVLGEADLHIGENVEHFRDYADKRINNLAEDTIGRLEQKAERYEADTIAQEPGESGDPTEETLGQFAPESKENDLHNPDEPTNLCPENRENPWSFPSEYERYLEYWLTADCLQNIKANNFSEGFVTIPKYNFKVPEPTDHYQDKTLSTPSENIKEPPNARISSLPSILIIPSLSDAKEEPINISVGSGSNLLAPNQGFDSKPSDANVQEHDQDQYSILEKSLISPTEDEMLAHFSAGNLISHDEIGREETDKKVELQIERAQSLPINLSPRRGYSNDDVIASYSHIALVYEEPSSISTAKGSEPEVGNEYEVKEDLQDPIHEFFLPNIYEEIAQEMAKNSDSQINEEIVKLFQRGKADTKGSGISSASWDDVSTKFKLECPHLTRQHSSSVSELDQGKETWGHLAESGEGRPKFERPLYLILGPSLSITRTLGQRLSSRLQLVHIDGSSALEAKLSPTDPLDSTQDNENSAQLKDGLSVSVQSVYDSVFEFLKQQQTFSKGFLLSATIDSKEEIHMVIDLLSEAKLKRNALRLRKLIVLKLEKKRELSSIKQLIRKMPLNAIEDGEAKALEPYRVIFGENFAPGGLQDEQSHYDHTLSAGETIELPIVTTSLQIVPEDWEQRLCKQIDIIDEFARNVAAKEVFVLQRMTSSIEELEATVEVELRKDNFTSILNHLPYPRKLESSEYSMTDDDLSLVNEKAHGLSEESLVTLKWSNWRNICPVSGVDYKKIRVGDMRLTAKFGDVLFAFTTEVARNKFMENPNYYSIIPADVVRNTNIVILGPPKCGKKTQAKLLEKEYGLKHIHVPYLIEKAYNKYRGEIFSERQGENGLVDTRLSKSVSSLSAEIDVAALVNGRTLAFSWAARLIASELKAEQMYGSSEDQTVAEEAASDEQSHGESSVAESKLKEPTRGKVALRNGFVLTGVVESDAMLLALKEFDIEIDVIIALQKTNTVSIPPANASASKAWSKQTLHSLPLSFENYHNKLDEIDANYATVPIGLSIDDAMEAIKRIINPNYSNWAVPTSNSGEEGNLGHVTDKQNGKTSITNVLQTPRNHSPKQNARLGSTGMYCPVLLEHENWLFPGSIEFARKFKNQTYYLSSSKAAAKFSVRPESYIPEEGINIPPPRIMLLGPPGAQTTAHACAIASHYGFPVFSCEQELNKVWIKAEADDTRAQGKGSQHASPYEDAPFTVEHVKSAFNSITGAAVIDGRVGFHAHSELYQEKSIATILFDGERLPDIVIFLECSTAIAKKRTLEIDTEFDEFLQYVKINNYSADEEKASIYEGKGEEVVPDGVALVSKHFNQTKKLQDRLLNAAKEDFYALDIPYRTISSDADFGLTQSKLIEIFDSVASNRLGWVRRAQCQPISSKDAKILLDLNVAHLSSFGYFSPMDIDAPVPKLDDRFPTLFQNKIYLLNSEKEREEFCSNSFLNAREVLPSPTAVVPSCLVLGPVSEEKRMLANSLCKQLGAIHVEVGSSILEFSEASGNPFSGVVKTTLRNGGAVKGNLVLESLLWKLNRKECVEYGWVLSDYPTNTRETVELSCNGVAPLLTLILKPAEAVGDKNLDERFCNVTRSAEGETQGVHCSSEETSAAQVQNQLPQKKLPEPTLNGDVFYLDSTKSEWSICDAAKELCINQIAKKQLQLRLDQQKLEHYQENSVSREMSANATIEFGPFCCVEWFKEGLATNCLDTGISSTFRGQRYYFASNQNLKDFLSNPNLYIMNPMLTSEERPIPITSEILRLSGKALRLLGCCPISFQKRQILQQGKMDCMASFKGEYYAFIDDDAREVFLTNPKPYICLESVNPEGFPSLTRTHSSTDAKDHSEVNKEDAGNSTSNEMLLQAVCETLLFLGEHRVKHHGKTLQETILILAALHLKLHNVLNSPEIQVQHQKAYQDYLKGCSLSTKSRNYTNLNEKLRFMASRRTANESDGAEPLN